MKRIVRDLTHPIPKVLNGMRLMGNGISLVSFLLLRGSMEYDRPAIPNILFNFGENFYFLVWCTSYSCKRWNFGWFCDLIKGLVSNNIVSICHALSMCSCSQVIGLRMGLQACGVTEPEAVWVPRWQAGAKALCLYS